MLRLLILLFALMFVRMPAEAQAKLVTYSTPGVWSVVVGAQFCTFWFHKAVAPPYDAEIACYDGADGVGAPVFIMVITATTTFVGSWNTVGGTGIAWEIHPNTPVTTVLLVATDPAESGGVQLLNSTF